MLGVRIFRGTAYRYLGHESAGATSHAYRGAGGREGSAGVSEGLRRRPAVRRGRGERVLFSHTEWGSLVVVVVAAVVAVVALLLHFPP